MGAVLKTVGSVKGMGFDTSGFRQNFITMKIWITLFLLVGILLPLNAQNSPRPFQVNDVKSNSYYYQKYNGNVTSPGRKSPRKVRGYTSTGDSINTEGRAGNPDNMWEDGYEYYYYNNRWYRTDGSGWEYWNTLLGIEFLEFLGYYWQSSNTPGSTAVHYYEENPTTPIGDGEVVMLILCLLCVVGKLYPPSNLRDLHVY